MAGSAVFVVRTLVIATLCTTSPRKGTKTHVIRKPFFSHYFVIYLVSEGRMY